MIFPKEDWLRWFELVDEVSVGKFEPIHRKLIKLTDQFLDNCCFSCKITFCNYEVVSLEEEIG